jgi:hypothetical protein
MIVAFAGALPTSEAEEAEEEEEEEVAQSRANVVYERPGQFG